MNTFDYGKTLKEIQERYVGGSVSIYVLEKEIFETKREIEKNDDKIGRHRDFVGHLLALLALTMTLNIAILDSLGELFWFLKMVAILILFIIYAICNYRDVKKNNEERNELYTENETLLLKVEIIEKELIKRREYYNAEKQNI